MSVPSASSGRSDRVVFVEFVVGAIMILVVMIHGCWNLCEFSCNFYDPAAEDFIGSITDGMGPMSAFLEIVYAGLFIFFMISGYFYKPGRSHSESLRRRLRKMVPAFLVCIVVLPLIIYLIMCAQGTTVTPDRAAYNIAAFLLGQSFVNGLGIEVEFIATTEVLGPYYFIETMIFADIIFFSIARWALAKDSNTVIAIIITLLIGGAMATFSLGIFNTDKSFIAVAFMLFGTYLKRVRFFETMDERIKTLKHWLLFIALLAAAYVLAMFFPTGMAFDHSCIGQYGVASAFTLFALATTSMFALVTILEILYKIPGFRQLVSFIGRYPYQILLFNLFYLVLPALIIKGEVENCWFFADIPEALPYVFFSIAMSVLTAWTMGRIKTMIKERKVAQDSQ